MQLLGRIDVVLRSGSSSMRTPPAARKEWAAGSDWQAGKLYQPAIEHLTRVYVVAGEHTCPGGNFAELRRHCHGEIGNTGGRWRRILERPHRALYSLLGLKDSSRSGSLGCHHVYRIAQITCGHCQINLTVVVRAKKQSRVRCKVVCAWILRTSLPIGTIST
jgi:hypothetical protein